MSMRMYRCNNCEGLEFQADLPVCPKCKSDLRDPRIRSRGVISELVVIHFDSPSGVEGMGTNVAACDSSLRVGRVMATGVATVVNCPRCKETAAWKDAMSEFNPKYDVPSNTSG